MNQKTRFGRLEHRQGLVGWFFVLPFVAGFLLIYLDVIVRSVQFCFSDLEMTPTGYIPNFVGWEHFHAALLEDPNYTKNLVTSLTSVLSNVPVIIIFSLFIATMLNQDMHGRGFFRALFFVPVILATGIVARADIDNIVMTGYQNMTGISTGLTSSGTAFDISSITSALQEMNLGNDLMMFILGIVNDIYDVVNRSGVQIILFLAGLQGISPSIYEAADIEGATGWEKFWKITFPMLSPIIFVNCVYSAIDLFTSSTNPIMIMVSNNSMASVNDAGLSAAMSWLYFLVILAILAVITLIGRKLVFHQDRG